MQPRSASYLFGLASALGAAGDTGRALALLELAEVGEAGSGEALALKGDLLRSRGELQKAAEVFDLIDRSDSNHSRARYLSALLRGVNPPLPDSRPAPWPSPFVRREHVFDCARHAELLALMTSPDSTFEPSTVGASRPKGRERTVKLDVRTSLRLTSVGPMAMWMRSVVEHSLPSVTAQLGLMPFAAAEIESKCTAYADGSFFSAHSDSLFHPSRRISFVYYFHRLPKRYTGGALLLYDGDVADPKRFLSGRLTRLDTLDNSVVFFPSGTYHEVTPVVSPSGLFEDGRFTIAGHVHAVD